MDARDRRDPAPRWWAIRPAQNRKPVTYTCPLCGRRLPALIPHALIAPEGDPARRRHAHAECVAAARGRGELRTRAEYRRTLPAPPGFWRRLTRRAR